jgi:hypothetical protein
MICKSCNFVGEFKIIKIVTEVCSNYGDDYASDAVRRITVVTDELNVCPSCGLVYYGLKN